MYERSRSYNSIRAGGETVYSYLIYVIPVQARVWN